MVQLPKKRIRTRNTQCWPLCAALLPSDGSARSTSVHALTQMVRGEAAGNFNDRHNRREVAFRPLRILRIASINACSTTCSHAEYAAHISAAEMQKPPPCRAGVSGLGSLTITYFHTGIRTIIGVESFHGPVRDGKGWDRLAMVIRQRGLFCWRGQQNQSWKKQ